MVSNTESRDNGALVTKAPRPLMPRSPIGSDAVDIAHLEFGGAQGPPAVVVGIAATIEPLARHPALGRGTDEQPPGHEGDVPGKPQVVLDTRAQRTIRDRAGFQFADREIKREVGGSFARPMLFRAVSGLALHLFARRFAGKALLEWKWLARLDGHRLRMEIDCQTERQDVAKRLARR